MYCTCRRGDAMQLFCVLEVGTLFLQILQYIAIMAILSSITPLLNSQTSNKHFELTREILRNNILLGYHRPTSQLPRTKIIYVISPIFIIDVDTESVTMKITLKIRNRDCYDFTEVLKERFRNEVIGIYIYALLPFKIFVCFFSVS